MATQARHQVAWALEALPRVVAAAAAARPVRASRRRKSFRFNDVEKLRVNKTWVEATYIKDSLRRTRRACAS